MISIDETQFRAFLLASGISHPAPRPGVGCALAYVQGPFRTIVIQLDEDEDPTHTLKATERILDLEDQWILFPRYGCVVTLGLASIPAFAVAIRFEPDERPALAEYLCTRSMDPGGASRDLYVISGSGRALVTWDHHTEDEGLIIELRDVSCASTLLIALNGIGTNLELFSSV